MFSTGIHSLPAKEEKGHILSNQTSLIMLTERRNKWKVVLHCVPTMCFVCISVVFLWEKVCLPII